MCSHIVLLYSYNNGDTSKAAGAKKLSESQKAKALWAMKAAKDREEDFFMIPPKRQHLAKEIDKTRFVGRASRRSIYSYGQKL